MGKFSALKCAYRVLLLTSGLLLSGCQLASVDAIQSAPDVRNRFTVDPLAKETKGRKAQPPEASSMVPSLRLGLSMQSGIDAVQTQFASRLGPILVRELQLSKAAVAVEPLAALQPIVPVSTLSPQATSDVISVAFSEPQSTLPSELPPNPMLMSKSPPLVDQILVVRVIEYRPYFPILATLELRVLHGETQDPLFATTATWSGADYRLDEHRPKPTWKDKWKCSEPGCQPSPENNSPQALMHEISRDVTQWYNASINPEKGEHERRTPTLRQRLASPFRRRSCETCDPAATAR